jgi:PAS domain S-box-containing protein
MIDLDKFTQRLEEARLKSFGRIPTKGIVADPALVRLLGELEENWEELRVAEEELRQQNDELIDARDSLEAERARYQSLFDEAPAGYVVTDTAGVIREINRQATGLLGVPRRAMLGKPFVLFLPEGSKGEFRLRLAGLVKSAAMDDWQTTLVPRNGEAFPASLSAAVTDAPNGEREVRWMVRDVTELERRVASRTAELAVAHRAKDVLLQREQELRERAEQADRAKVAFLATQSHELRTPITALVGWVHLMLHGR